MKKQKIKVLSDRDHVLQKSGMYIGSTTLEPIRNYFIEDNKIIKKEISYVSGLIKIFNELIDNAVDEHIRTNEKYANKIEVFIDERTFSIKDNGRGIPVEEIDTPKGRFNTVQLAFTELKAGGNFNEDSKMTGGTHGVGAALASILSLEFVATSNDSNKKAILRTKNNNEEIELKITKPTGRQGTSVTLIPDLKRFGLEEIDETYFNIIKQRLLYLSVSYPNINFKFNGKTIKVNNKKFVQMFGENATIINEEDFTIAVLPSKNNEFEHFTLLNGLIVSNGGNHVDYLKNKIISHIRGKVSKKYKNIKPADIESKLFIVCLMKKFPDAKWETQTKESLKNPLREISNYFKDLDLDKFVDKVYKNKAITDSVLDYFKIQEEYKKKKELKGLSKVKKKIRSEKYTKAVGKNDILVIGEGQSAVNGLLPSLGRKGIAYYELKGKILNAHKANQSKFTSNKELSELYQIVKNEGFNKIVVASDADLDGIAINGLVIAFFDVYLKQELKDGKLYRLNTPVGIQLDNKRKLTNWVYDLKDMETLKGSNVKYMKGLGSWTPKQLQEVIQKDNLDKMLVQLTYTDNSEESILEWYSDKHVIERKEKIIENKDFSIVKL